MDWWTIVLRTLWCLPLVLIACGWTRLYWKRSIPTLPTPWLVSLVCATLPAVVAVGGFIYFTVRPSPLTPWPPSYYGLYAWVILSSLVGVVVASVLWRTAPRWLFGIELFSSGCLLVLSLLAASTI
jgi:hypothetical protein